MFEILRWFTLGVCDQIRSGTAPADPSFVKHVELLVTTECLQISAIDSSQGIKDLKLLVRFVKHILALTRTLLSDFVKREINHSKWVTTDRFMV